MFNQNMNEKINFKKEGMFNFFSKTICIYTVDKYLT